MVPTGYASTHEFETVRMSQNGTEQGVLPAPMASWEASVSSWDGDCRSGRRRAGAVHMSSGSR
eukprot:Gb_32733 [translate_table: standard]